MVLLSGRSKQRAETVVAQAGQYVRGARRDLKKSKFLYEMIRIKTKVMQRNLTS